MKAYILQENNPQKGQKRVVGMSNNFLDIAHLLSFLYPNYEEYGQGGILYNKKSLDKNKKIQKLKNLCVVEFDFGKERESHVGVPINESDLEIIEKSFGNIIDIVGIQ